MNLCMKHLKVQCHVTRSSSIGSDPGIMDVHRHVDGSSEITMFCNRALHDSHIWPPGGCRTNTGLLIRAHSFFYWAKICLLQVSIAGSSRNRVFYDTSSGLHDKQYVLSKSNCFFYRDLVLLFLRAHSVYTKQHTG